MEAPAAAPGVIVRCVRDGTLMREDVAFTLDAAREGVTVRRYVCVAGHSIYPGPEPEQRGYVPRMPHSTCSTCGTEIPVTRPGTPRRRHRCDACGSRQSMRCTNCGKPTENYRFTCSDACLRARATRKRGRFVSRASVSS